MSSGHTRARIDDLTETQRRVLELIVAGRTNYEIGQALGLTLDGAKYHVTEILNKLGVDSREEAAALIAPERHGWRQRLSTRRLVIGVGAVAAVVLALGILLTLRQDDPSRPLPEVQVAFLVGEFDPEGRDLMRQITIVDSDGKTRTIGDPAPYGIVEWAPDGVHLLAMQLGGAAELHVDVFDTRQNKRESWEMPGLPRGWAWSPDGALLGINSLDSANLPSRVSTLSVVRTDGSTVASTQLERRSEEATQTGKGVLWSPDSRWVVGWHGRDMTLLSTSGESRVLPLPDTFGPGPVTVWGWTDQGLRISEQRTAPPPTDPPTWLLPDPRGDWQPAGYPSLPDFAEIQAIAHRFEPQYSHQDTTAVVDRDTSLLDDAQGWALVFTDPRTSGADRPPPVRFVLITAGGGETTIQAPPDVHIPGSTDAQISVVTR